MTYDDIVLALFHRFPKLEARWKAEFPYLKDEAPPYVVFGSLLIPALEEALEACDLGRILPFCAFLEDAAEAARTNTKLEELLHIEIGEWLGATSYAPLIAPWLGVETKRICAYIPGIATQPLELRKERCANSLWTRIRSQFASLLFFRWNRR